MSAEAQAGVRIARLGDAADICLAPHTHCQNFPFLRRRGAARDPHAWGDLVGIGGQGRPSKPTALKILEGDRSSRVNRSEPQPAMSEVRAPRWLSPKAKYLWRSLAPDLEHRGVLTFWDVQLFAHWCHAVVRAREAAAHVSEEGEVVVTERGRVKNPWFQVWRDSTAVMLKIGSRFGLSPSDRAQLTFPEMSDTELDELLS